MASPGGRIMTDVFANRHQSTNLFPGMSSAWSANQPLFSVSEHRVVPTVLSVKGLNTQQPSAL